jgi:O-antigen biosynthesis protein
MKTSIIILTYNKLEYTKKCIESIRQYTEPNTYEIIIIDNASTDGTVDWLKQQKDIKAIFNENNVGFPKGCNQGIEVSSGENILLLNNDVIVTKNWLTNLLACLYSSEKIGAVGPVTNYCSYYQTIPVSYGDDLDEMHNFASVYNRLNPDLWEQRIKLIGYCVLIRKEVIDKIGLLDERFSPGNFEDDDYSYRIVQAGYQLVLCKDTFIHHFGSTSFNEQSEKYTTLLKENANKFKEKWGFDSRYSSFIRHEILDLMDSHDLNSEIRVLEVGCACGATLLQIKNMYKNAQLFGIELNENAASIASNFTNIKAVDVEKNTDYPENFFDYIIFADVLEHLYDPWRVLENMKRHLKEGGKLLASIPNVMHYSVLKDVINGHWTYRDSGLLDRTHIRFFTLNEILKMFNKTLSNNVQVSAITLPETLEEQNWVNIFSTLSGSNNKEQFKVYQYLIKAQKPKKLEMLLSEIKIEDKKQKVAIDLLEYCKTEKIEASEVIQTLIDIGLNEVEILNHLASLFYNDQRIEDAFTFLEKAYYINPDDVDTLFNLGLVLHVVGENELALNFLNKIQFPNEETISLIEEIKSFM